MLIGPLIKFIDYRYFKVAQKKKKENNKNNISGNRTH